MVQATCKRTGIEFTAKTARSETHPAISALLKTANERRRYSEVVALVEAMRRDGCRDLAAYEAAINAAMSEEGARYAAFGKNSYASQNRGNGETNWDRMAEEGRTIYSN